jgi:hypothetical protein
VPVVYSVCAEMALIDVEAKHIALKFVEGPVPSDLNSQHREATIAFSPFTAQPHRLAIHTPLTALASPPLAADMNATTC